MSKEKYYKLFDTVEVQQTFYKIPKEETLKKLQEKAPKNFIFNIKCFQGVTHPLTSKTWKRFGKEIKGDFGYLKPKKEVFESWEKTLKACEILKAKIILIQLPKSFKETKENLENARKFFSKIERKDFKIALELRGWSFEGIEKLCKKFELIDVCDLNLREPLYITKNKIAYFRLHGAYKNSKIIYNHSYSKEELENLADKIKKLKAKEVWVYFNNKDAIKNANELKKILNIS